MNTKILETLEFNKIKALFEPHLLTEQGLEELKGLAPTAKVDKIKQAFTEMEEMQALFCENNRNCRYFLSLQHLLSPAPGLDHIVIPIKYRQVCITACCDPSLGAVSAQTAGRI